MTNPNAIILCTDARMMIPALYVAESVIRHAGGKLVDTDVIIISEISAAGPIEQQWMASRNIIHTPMDFTSLRSVFDGQGRLSAATLVKLKLAELYAQIYDRILYLDTDLTIHADLTPLLTLDIGRLPLAANRRGMIFRSQSERLMAERHFADLGMTKPYAYFNSGVMLIDVRNWNRKGLTAQSLDFIRHYPQLCPLPDEDSLNALLNGQFAPLSPVWNMPPRRDIYHPIFQHIEPAIIHYSGPDKPWKRFGKDKPLFPDPEAYRIFKSFLLASPWPNWLNAQWTVFDLIENLGSTFRSLFKTIGDVTFARNRADKNDYARRMKDYVRSANFIDVTQNLVIREGATLRVNRNFQR